MYLQSTDARAQQVVGAIRSGNVESLAQHLLDVPELAQARLVDERGVSRSLLHVVTDWPGHAPRCAATIRLLIRAGADVNARLTSEGAPVSAETPLHWAASCNDVAAIDALLEGGADLEATGAVHTGGTAMSDAVVFAQWDAARRLLERGAKTTLWQAAALGLVDRLAEYFAAPFSPTAAEVTNAFWNACRGGQRAAAEWLYERGVELNWIGHDHQTPYDVARAAGHDDLFAWLVAIGGRSAQSLS